VRVFRILFAIGITALCTNLHAFRGEVAVGYVDLDEDTIETESYSGEIVWFFNEVATDKGPLGEAEFLSPQSAVLARWSRVESSISSPDSAPFPLFFSDIETDADDYLLGGRYVTPNDRWVLDLTARRNEVDSAFDDQDFDAYGFGVGFYITPTLRANVNYEWFEVGMNSFIRTLTSSIRINQSTDVHNVEFSVEYLATVLSISGPM